jgi:hypothetical protein
MDPERPGRHAPRQCSTLTLSDLGDTVGFREPADIHKTYGFKTDDKGYYSRAEIPLGRPADDEWDVHLEVRRAVAYLEHNHMLVRLENLGKCLVSYQACKMVTRSSSQNPEVNYKSLYKSSYQSQGLYLWCAGDRDQTPNHILYEVYYRIYHRP